MYTYVCVCVFLDGYKYTCIGFVYVQYVQCTVHKKPSINLLLALFNFISSRNYKVRRKY